MLRELIVRFGPLAVLGGAAVEGDVTLLLAGVSAHLGLLGLGPAVVAGALGTFVGDLVYFGLGRGGAAAVRGSAAIDTQARRTPIVTCAGWLQRARRRLRRSRDSNRGSMIVLPSGRPSARSDRLPLGRRSARRHGTLSWAHHRPATCQAGACVPRAGPGDQ